MLLVEAVWLPIHSLVLAERELRILQASYGVDIELPYMGNKGF